MRKYFFFMFASLVLVFLLQSVYADSVLQLPNTIGFDIVLTREGEESLYFSSPDDYESQIMDSLAFDLVSNPAQALSATREKWVGVVWELYPDLTAVASVSLYLEASAQPSYNGPAGFMLQEMSDSSLGLNFSMYCFDGVEAKTRPAENTATSSKSLSVDERNKGLPASDRRIQIFSQSPATGSISGHALVKLKLDPPLQNGEPVFTDGDYMGNLILHVETY